MRIDIQNKDGSWESYLGDTISLELDNNNEVRISEIESGLLEVENITHTVRKNDKYGLVITPQDYSTVHIIPEG